MKLFNILALAGLSSSLLTSCYKDLGTYAYTKSVQVEFGNAATTSYSFIAGEDFEIDAPIKLSEEIEDVDKEFIIEWYMDRKLINTGYHLKYNIENGGAYELIIKVSNRRTGEVFIMDRPLTINIKNSFEWGWMILSDMGDGKSSLSFITPEFKCFHNISRSIEGGLGTGPKGISYYYVLGSIPGSYVSGLPKIIINQASGSITLDGNSLKKDMALSDEFENGEEPEKLEIAAFAFKIKYYAIFSKEGKVYIRGVGYDNHSIPYYGRYTSSPYEFDGGAKISCVSTFHNNTFHCFDEKNCLLYDSMHGRFLCITDSGYGKPYFPSIVYLRTYDQNLTIPSGVLRVDNMGVNTKCLGIGAFENVDVEGEYHALVMWSNYISLIDVNGTGDYQIFEFSVRNMSKKTHLITSTQQYPFSGASIMRDESIVCMSSNFSKNPYFYFTDGDKNLYAYNMKSHTHALVYEAKGRIVKINGSPVVSEFSEYGGHSTSANFRLALAQEGGGISIIDVSPIVMESIFSGILRKAELRYFDGFGDVKGIVWCTNYQGEY